VETYGRAKQATSDSIVWDMRILCWITMATDTLRIGSGGSLNSQLPKFCVPMCNIGH
jgi:hypothetical protein